MGLDGRESLSTQLAAHCVAGALIGGETREGATDATRATARTRPGDWVREELGPVTGLTGAAP